MEQYVKAKQMEIVAEIEKLDGNKFRVDTWQRAEGGEGYVCVFVALRVATDWKTKVYHVYYRKDLCLKRQVSMSQLCMENYHQLQ